MNINYDVGIDFALSIIREERLKRDINILDVGGAMKPLVMATHVMDTLSYSERNTQDQFKYFNADRESFTEETWAVRDICETPWPYRDKVFEFVWCTQTIEDVRDPIAVIKEIARVGKRGFITTIDRNYESQLGINHPNYAGYIHHRWLIEPSPEGLVFVYKYPIVHLKEYTPRRTGKMFLNCWWDDHIMAKEVNFKGVLEIQQNFLDYAKKCEEVS